MMSKQQVQEQRLKEITAMVGTLAERMMTAYVLGTRPGEAEVKAFCQGVLLLEEYAVPLPLFAEDVIGRLARQDDVGEAAPVAQLRQEPNRRVSMRDRLFHPFGALRAAWADYVFAPSAAISAKA